MRKYLVFMSVGAGGPVSNLFEAHREYDVYFHNYSDAQSPRLREAEYYHVGPGEKLNIACSKIPNLPVYHQYAFLDDDLSLTTDELNRLFQVGDALRLPIYQPALTGGSNGSHRHLFQSPYTGPVRKVPFVEIMCPFFSADALVKCLPTFDINESGWGLDLYMWPLAVGGETYVVNSIPIGHYRTPERRMRILKNGLTPMQELWIQQRIHDPRPDNVNPPGFKHDPDADNGRD